VQRGLKVADRARVGTPRDPSTRSRALISRAAREKFVSLSLALDERGRGDRSLHTPALRTSLPPSRGHRHSRPALSA